MKLCYDYAFGALVFTEDGSFKCPICGGLTPNQRNLKRGEKIICSKCESVFKKEEFFPFNPDAPSGLGFEHGARFVMYGPQFHVTYVFHAPSSRQSSR
jgi:hypothetical protein